MRSEHRITNCKIVVVDMDDNYKHGAIKILRYHNAELKEEKTVRRW